MYGLYDIFHAPVIDGNLWGIVIKFIELLQVLYNLILTI